MGCRANPLMQMVLEKDSSVLGYPGETSKGLDADHQGVCKYESPTDPNYVAVRNILKTLMSKIIVANPPKKRPATTRKQSYDLRATLAISEVPTVDYSFYRDQWARGTCDWLLHDEDYLRWRNAPDPSPYLLWLNGGPASGKSVIASYIIDCLVQDSVCCQYFFIRFGDRKKRSLNLLLRSLVFQLAQQIPEFLARVIEVAEEGVQLETADPRVIWERLFRTFEFNLGGSGPIFWIIDGLDEADDPKAFLRLIADIGLSNSPLRILIVSRKTSDIDTAFLKLPETLSRSSISIGDHQTRSDLVLYIDQELSLPEAGELRSTIVQRILAGAQANFLVRLDPLIPLCLC